MEKLLMVTMLSACLFISGYTFHMLSGSGTVIRTVVSQIVK